MAAINDHISNLLTRLRNAQTARFEQLELPATNILQNIAQILKEGGSSRDTASSPTRPRTASGSP